MKIRVRPATETLRRYTDSVWGGPPRAGKYVAWGPSPACGPVHESPQTSVAGPERVSCCSQGDKTYSFGCACCPHQTGVSQNKKNYIHLNMIKNPSVEDSGIFSSKVFDFSLVTIGVNMITAGACKNALQVKGKSYRTAYFAFIRANRFLEQQNATQKTLENAISKWQRKRR